MSSTPLISCSSGVATVSAIDLRVRAGIGRAHHHRRRHDFRVFADRQQRERDQARDEDHDRQHRRRRSGRSMKKWEKFMSGSLRTISRSLPAEAGSQRLHGATSLGPRFAGTTKTKRGSAERSASVAMRRAWRWRILSAANANPYAARVGDQRLRRFRRPQLRDTRAIAIHRNLGRRDGDARLHVLQSVDTITLSAASPELTTRKPSTLAPNVTGRYSSVLSAFSASTILLAEVGADRARRSGSCLSRRRRRA